MAPPLREVSRQAMDRLLRDHWPGNVRELENVLEHAAIVAPGPPIEIDDSLAPECRGAGPPFMGQTLEDVERAHILSMLKRTHWAVSGERFAKRGPVRRWRTRCSPERDGGQLFCDC